MIMTSIAVTKTALVILSLVSLVFLVALYHAQTESQKEIKRLKDENEKLKRRLEMHKRFIDAQHETLEECVRRCLNC